MSISTSLGVNPGDAPRERGGRTRPFCPRLAPLSQLGLPSGDITPGV